MAVEGVNKRYVQDINKDIQDKESEYEDIDIEVENIVSEVINENNVEIYFWGITGAGVGHLSLELSDSTYISHWPISRLKALFGRKGKCSPSLQDDIDEEKRPPDDTLQLNDGLVDQDKIRSWWFKVKDTVIYNLLYSNCAQVVRKALKKGGILQYQPIRYALHNFPKHNHKHSYKTSFKYGYKYGKRYDYKHGWVTPKMVLEWARQCDKFYRLKHSAI